MQLTLLQPDRADVLKPPSLADLNILSHFIPRQQFRTLLSNTKGEEGPYFKSLLEGLSSTIRTMAKTYDQDGLGSDSIVHLHYFHGGSDWWITEKDKTGVGTIQAFGYVDLGYGGEWGYISINELVDTEIELDLHWVPKPQKECLKD
jgi:hypothetical protein